MQEDTTVTTNKKFSWRIVAGKGILVAKLFTLLFVLGIVARLTWDRVPAPYGSLLVGLELAITMMMTFIVIRRNTFPPTRSYNFDALRQQKDPVQWLLTRITYDISRYQEGAAYFYNGVRLFKYLTAILAGISTIVLGLDFGDNENIYILPGISYTLFAKNLALVIGAIIAVSSTLMAYWNIEKYWMFNKTIVNKLRALQQEVEKDYLLEKFIKTQNGAKILDEENFAIRLNEYRNIKGDFYKYWEGALADRGAASTQRSGNGQ